MNVEYPNRSMPALWIRYSCMAFGLANVIGGISYAATLDRRVFMAASALLVGGAWFAFGKYGGLPLVDTVTDWHPPATPDSVTEVHRTGLLAMRRRKWMMLASVPVVFALAPLLISLLMPVGQPELVVFLLGVPFAIVSLRYLLSRCPRCGNGFFTRSSSRAATLRLSKTCGHCGLSLHAHK
jgi:hypothetical protein